MTHSVDLKRITTAYVEQEDRIRLGGELPDKSTVVMWLTQRLLGNLLPHLLLFLEQEMATSHAQEAVQSFKQHMAQAQLPHQEPVQVGFATSQWLVTEVDILHSAEHVALTFKNPAAQPSRLVLTHQALRQWLGIVQDQYRVARWPKDAWPTWMALDAGNEAHSQPMLH